MCYNGFDFASTVSSHARLFMFARHLFGAPRRPAVLLIPPHPTSNSSLFIALLQECKSHPLTFQFFPHSLRKTPRCHQERDSPFGIDSRERPLPLFRVFVFRGSRTTLHGPRSRNPFIGNTYKKGGWGIMLATVPLAAPPDRSPDARHGTRDTDHLSRDTLHPLQPICRLRLSPPLRENLSSHHASLRPLALRRDWPVESTATKRRTNAK